MFQQFTTSLELLFRQRLVRVFVFAGLLTSTVFAQLNAIPQATSVRIADAVCSDCHREIFNRYIRTPMANASGIATEHPIAGTLQHANSGISYSVSLDQQGMWLNYKNNVSDGPHGKQRLDYFLGSGHLGVTYMYVLDGYLLESPVAYYTTFGGYDMKPGLASSTAMPPALPMSSQCLRCHMSAVQSPDPGTINRYQGLPFLHGGISCESCHGDTRSHVASGGKKAVINPVKLDAERRDSICISCHLEGDTSVEHRDRSLANYKPGDRITDYVAYFTYRGADFTTRGVSEVEELDTSQCKRMSGARMSCTSCHDPHGGPSPEDRVSFYRSKCLTCHSAKVFATDHHSDTPDCTTCHMPSAKADNIPHVAWKDHRIRAIPSDVRLSALPAEPAELALVLGGDPAPRELALAYYNLTVDGHGNERDRAWRALRQLQEPDAAVLSARGYLSQLMGSTDAAMSDYRETLKLDPTNLFALNNLGSLLARSGNLQSATGLWEKAFQLNEDIESLGLNLAIGECRLGKRNEARSVLQRVLKFSPGSIPAQKKLQMVDSGQEQCRVEVSPPNSPR